MPGTDYVSAINVHMCRSVVPGRAGGHVPGMSAAYENQAEIEQQIARKFVTPQRFPQIQQRLERKTRLKLTQFLLKNRGTHSITRHYYMASSASGQDESNPAL